MSFFESDDDRLPVGVRNERLVTQSHAAATALRSWSSKSAGIFWSLLEDLQVLTPRTSLERRGPLAPESIEDHRKLIGRQPKLLACITGALFFLLRRLNREKVGIDVGCPDLPVALRVHAAIRQGPLRDPCDIRKTQRGGAAMDFVRDCSRTLGVSSKVLQIPLDDLRAQLNFDFTLF